MKQPAAGGEAARPDTVALARLARGLTQNELSARTGISQAHLSKVEKGAVDLSGHRLIAVAQALSFPPSLLTLPQHVSATTTACVFPRKRNSLPVSAERRVRAILDVTRLQVTALMAELLPPVELGREAPSVDGWVGPEDLAIETRQRLGFDSGPLPDLTAALEAAGVMVVAQDLGTRRLDAVGQWPVGERPLFLVNKTAPGDRQRFTLAHEVGHAVMHTEPTADQEPQADRFASELLMPAADIRSELVDPTMGRLVQLKKRWRVSIAALIRRARDVGAINDYRYKQLNIELSAAGYRTREPASFEPERPARLYASLASRVEAEGGPSRLAAEAHMIESEFVSLYLEGQQG